MKNQRELARLLARRDRTPSGLSGPQVQYSSIEDGSLKEYDENGNLVAEHGKQWDGSHGVYPLTGPTPPRPTPPSVEVGTSATISWDGVFVNADGTPDITITPTMDWSRVEIHLSQTKGFQALSADTLVDTIETPRGGSRPALLGPGKWYAVLVARSMPGKASEQSQETEFEVLPGITEEDIQEIRDSFGGVADGLQQDLANLGTELESSKSRLDEAQLLLDAIPGQLVTAREEALAATAEYVEEALKKGQNLLPNGGFEDGITGWQENAGGVVTAAAARSGALGMHLNPTTGNVWPLASMITTATGRKYHVEMWVRRTGTDTWSTQAIGFVPQTRDAANNYATPVIHLFNEDGSPLRTGDISTTAFTRVEAEFTVEQEGAVGLSIGPWFYTSTANQYDVDDMALVDISAISLQVDKAKAEAIRLASEDAARKIALAETAILQAADLNAKSKVDTALLAAANEATEIANLAKSQAVEAAALDAQNKADEAERRAKAVAATAQGVAENASSAAASAVGIANGKSVVLVQSAAPAAEYRNNRTLWIDTTSNANTPKQWVSGITWAARTDKTATDAAAVAAAAAAAARTASDAAATAQSRADSAMSAAGSLNKVLYSAADPSGIAPVGSTWRKVNSSGDVIGEWRYTGGTPPWQAQLVSSEAISNLDVGKLTVGSGRFTQAVVEQFVADSATLIKADIGNLTVTGTSNLKDAVAERIAANVGSFVRLSATQVYIGQAGNLIPNGYGEMGDNSNFPSMGIYRNDPAAAAVGAEASFWLEGGRNQTTTEWFQLRPGAEYQFSVHVRSSVAGKRFYIQLITPDGVANTYLVSNQTTTTGFVKYKSALYTAPAGATKAKLMIYANHSNGTSTEGYQWFTAFDLREAITPALVVDGLVSGQNIIGAKIQTTATANRGVKITDAGLFAYNSSGVETLRFDGANSIITGATVRTATSGARVQISTVGLEAWGSDNTKYLSATASGLDLVGTVTATGDTRDTPGQTTGTLYTSRAILGRRTAQAGVDQSPGLWLEIDVNGTKQPALYPAGVRSTSPYNAQGAVLQSAQMNVGGSSSFVSVEPQWVTLEAKQPYSNGFASSVTMNLNREGGFFLQGRDGYGGGTANQGYALTGTSRRNGSAVGELDLSARQLLSLNAGTTPSNGSITLAAGFIDMVGSVSINGTVMDDSGWKLATYASPWSSYGNGFAPLSYRVLGGVLYVMGSIKGGASGSRIATLPAGYRPTIPTGTQALEAPLTSTQNGAWYAGSLWIYGDGRLVYTSPPGIWSGQDRVIINASFPLK